ncbi:MULTISPECIES: tail fiber assembly protein [unclassified Pseudocitrobacter]|uniref:tail fiber assembly protein n=1 Tax=unclassified Pseudocitrobacter TaxID=2638778 RepID=UPI0023E41A46|nr:MULTISPECIES: tail fiber assembly protein [unclassified Pseudocitrobacter]MDF3827799.1 tail fiber assembly protein [Pseudocitrobacter sp. 2023EL-00150]MEC5373654.1 tail fiber assembly protein [Pseudocitrobacter sp. MW920760]
MKPVFDDKGLAIQTGEIRCFYYDAVTFEYSGWSDEFINIGVSMPGDSTDIEPGEDVVGKAAVFNDAGWEYQADHRGETVYSIEDGTTSTVDYIGDIKAGFTAVAPATPYDKWNGSEWVVDDSAEQAAIVAANDVKKSQLRATADNEIEWRQDAVDAGIATEEETAALAEWKKYRVLLMRVDTADPEWPTPPTAQV